MDAAVANYLCRRSNNQILGTYYIKTNQTALVAMFATAVTWSHQRPEVEGLPQPACKHSIKVAQESGYKAMQFNFVASSNGAIRLWRKLGFETVVVAKGIQTSCTRIH